MSTTTSDDLLVSSAEGVTTITFNRPERKNALTIAMYERAVLALQMAATDPLVRVVLITGTGDSFTSGNDVADFMNTPPNGPDSPVFQFLLALASFEKPIVVAVNGTAVGIGVTLLQHVDIVYVADTAKLKMPFVTLGLSAEGGSTYLLPRMAGHAKAAELLLFGEAFDADTAVEVGLASTKLPAGQLLHYANERAKVLANERPLGSLITTKKLMRATVKDQTLKALHEEAVEFARHLASDEAKEAFTAFFEKRTPNFAQFNK
ncbi:MAG TPA: enoyl-CoA hydratase [Myxococcota bacterium]